MSLRVKFRLFQASTYGIVFATIAIMAVITGKYIETIGLLSLSFLCVMNLKRLGIQNPFGVAFS